jgi:hypothetical protein
MESEMDLAGAENAPLQFGFFPNFKGLDTLLIWGNQGFEKLRDLLLAVEEGNPEWVKFEETNWAKPVGDCSVTFVRRAAPSSEFVVRRNGTTTVIVCHMTSCVLYRFRCQLDSLVGAPGSRGHQYLDLPGPRQLQIMAAVGEYSASLRP